SRLFAEPGGTFTARSPMRPSETACKCSQMASSAMLGRNGVLGSSTCHPCSTNERKLRRACSARNAARGGSFDANDAGGALGEGNELLKFGGAKSGEIVFSIGVLRCDSDSCFLWREARQQ